MNPTLADAIRSNTTAEVFTDPVHLRAYSVDASIYEVEPQCIAVPKTKTDLIAIVKLAADFKISVIARGAATGITGGCLGEGLIVDLSKYLNHILAIDYDNEFAICEPGVVQDVLNAALSEKGYRLGPDTSTGDRATLGGMVANNSAGARSLRFGKMVDHVEEVELLLANGELHRFHAVDEETWKAKCLQDNAEGRIYRTVDTIRTQYHSEIRDRFPPLPRRATGYNLDQLIKPDFCNIAKLITGSEGTFGIVTEIKVKICKKPAHLGICVVHFHDISEGMKSIELMLKHKPLALEMIDSKILEAGKSSPALRNKLQWLQNTPAMIFVAEFDGNSSEETKEKLAAFEQQMRDKKIGYAWISLTDPAAMNNVWAVRKSGLGLLLSKRSYSRAIAFIEDLSVPPGQLAAFIPQFLQCLHRFGKDAGIYGHVGSGCMHIRPYIDLRQPSELALMLELMEEVSDLILEHKGALSGEHGDGLVRSWLNPKMFGEHIIKAFNLLKDAFDPTHTMNPGKIVEGPPFLHHLRLDPETPQKKIPTYLNFTRQGGFDLSADLCNGNGLCRKKEGTMCPSFQATGNEYDTTRARAQALRATINGHFLSDDLSSQDLYDVLDLCLECKGCKAECPSQVDMAKMKSEALYQYHRKKGYPLRSYLFGYIGDLNKFTAPFASIFNKIVNSALGKKILGKIGLAPERPLPPLAKQRFSSLFKSEAKRNKKVVLFNDTFNEFNTPAIGLAAARVLTALGYEVIVPKYHCCGRPLLSKGLLPQARKKAQQLIETLLPYAKEGISIVGLEPSCILTIKDDYQDLLPNDEDITALTQACITFDEFVALHIDQGKLPLSFNPLSSPILLHGHCHQKALVGTTPTLGVLRSLPGAKVFEIPSGCCGVAGSFGYEAEHYELSMKIGNLRLFPAVHNAPPNAIIVADGTSCRAQILHGTQRQAKHLAEVVADCLER